MKKTFTLNIKLPVADDAFGRWMEANGAHVSFSCTFGNYSVTIVCNKLHSYSDEEGEHREQWSITRSDKDFLVAMTKAVEAMKAKMQEVER